MREGWERGGIPNPPLRSHARVSRPVGVKTMPCSCINGGRACGAITRAKRSTPAHHVVNRGKGGCRPSKVEKGGVDSEVISQSTPPFLLGCWQRRRRRVGEGGGVRGAKSGATRLLAEERKRVAEGGGDGEEAERRRQPSRGGGRGNMQAASSRRAAAANSAATARRLQVRVQISIGGKRGVHRVTRRLVTMQEG
ncbi:hypothetical protein V8E53_002098 [Lactarius tabidus]